MAKILFVPLEPARDTMERTPSIIRELLKEHKVIGIPRLAFYGTNKNVIRYIRFLRYVRDVVKLGLTRRYNYDVIIVQHEYYLMVGYLIARLLNKPLIWDTFSWKKCFGPEAKSIATLIGDFIKVVGERFPGHIFIHTRAEMASPQLLRSLKSTTFFPTSADLDIIDKESIKRKGAVCLYLKRSGFTKEVSRLIFTDTRFFQPNRRAAWWINDYLAPELERRKRICNFLITSGGQIPTSKHKFVHFMGYVPYLYATIANCKIGLVPVREGRGALTKVVELMACGEGRR